MITKINEENGINSEVQRFAEQLHSTLMIPSIKITNNTLIIHNGNIPLEKGYKNEVFYLVLPNGHKFKFLNIKIIFSNDNSFMDTNDLKNHNFTLCLDNNTYGKHILYHEITHLYEILVKSQKNLPPRNEKSQNLYDLTNKYIQSNNPKVDLIKYFYYFDKMETAAQLHEIFQRLRYLYINTQTDFKSVILQLNIIKIAKQINSNNFIKNIENDINILQTHNDGTILVNELCKQFNCNIHNLPSKIDKYLKKISNKFILKTIKLNDLVVNKVKLKQAIEKQNIFIKIKNFLINLMSK